MCSHKVGSTVTIDGYISQHQGTLAIYKIYNISINISL